MLNNFNHEEVLDRFESSSSFDECRLLIFLPSVLPSSLDVAFVAASFGASVDAGFVELDQSRQSC